MNQYLDSVQEISLKTLEGYTFFKYSDIVRFEASGNYTLVYVLHQDKPQKVFHTFTEVEEKVSGTGLFYKCQRSNIINSHQTVYASGKQHWYFMVAVRDRNLVRRSRRHSPSGSVDFILR